MSGKTTYYQRNRQIILNRAKGYYKNHKERLREQARNKYKDLFEKEKDIKREYGRNGYKICLKKNKNLKVYQKIIVELIKMPLIKLKDQLVLIK